MREHQQKKPIFGNVPKSEKYQREQVQKFALWSLSPNSEESHKLAQALKKSLNLRGGEGNL